MARQVEFTGLELIGMRTLTSFRILRVTLAFVVALWMAGAGCLLGCENKVASAANEVKDEGKASALVVSGDACASAHSGSCCSSHGAKAKRSAKASQSAKSEHLNSANSKPAKDSSSIVPTLATDGSSSSMMNCPLAVNSTAVLSKSGPDHVDGHLAVANSSEPLTTGIKRSTAFVRPPRLPNLGHTYLRCCVFLI